MIVDDPYFLIWIFATVGFCWLLPRQTTHIALAITCALYLSIYSPWSLTMLLLTTCITGLAVITSKGRSAYLISAIVFHCIILLIYRIYVPPAKNIYEVLLLGFAFYTLRNIHLLLESYNGKISTPKWSELVGWLWFLPTLQVGPIHRFQPFQRDLLRRRWDSILFAQGLQRILIGYFKVVVLAKYLVSTKLVQLVDTLDSGSWWFHYCDSLMYGLNLYFKFSGYSDVAIGFSLLLGFRVMENFNFPFIATNISDFWRRWHISLSSWCRDYVYIPVFSIVRIPAIAAIATMLVLGLWHEFSWRYLLWGLWHGVGIAIHQRWQRSDSHSIVQSGIIAYIWRPASVFITLNFVILSFVITSASSIEQIITRWKILLWIAP